MLDEIDKSKKTIDGILNERRFSLLFEPDDEFKQGDSWMTEDLAIFQANPVAVNYDYILDDLIEKRQNVILYENARENFLCKHLNILYKGLGVEGYVDAVQTKIWSSGGGKEYILDLTSRRPMIIHRWLW